MKFFVTIFISLFLMLNNASASSRIVLPVDSIKLPKVFLLGEHEKEFEKLQQQYSTSLLSTCGYNPDLTFDKWAQFLIDMEDYSESINYDLKGVKMWIEVFWLPNGGRLCRYTCPCQCKRIKIIQEGSTPFSIIYF